MAKKTDNRENQNKEHAEDIIGTQAHELAETAGFGANIKHGNARIEGNSAQSNKIRQQSETATIMVKDIKHGKTRDQEQTKHKEQAKDIKYSKKTDFSNTVFTDRNRKEVARYKKYADKIHKTAAAQTGSRKPKKPIRFQPTLAYGLSNEQVAERVAAAQINYERRGSTKTYRNIFFTNIVTFFNLLCFTVAGFLIYVGFNMDRNAFNDMLFLVIIVINIVIGIFTEIKAKLIIEKLSVIASSRVKVIRNGEENNIVIDDVVLDDIVVLASGGQIPADCIVADGVIEVNESLLTGESHPIQKNKGDRIYAGSFVVSGTCYAKVDRVGTDNYISSIVKGATKYVRPRSELLQSLKLIIKVIGIIIVPLAGLLILTEIHNIATGETINTADAVRSSAGAVVGMIPSGMFLLTSMALAVGVINLKKTNTLVQELYCIEMLARVDTLCLDKTGTITDGTMKVCEVVEVKNSSDYTIREIVASMLWALDDNNQTAIALANHFDRNGIIKAVKTMPFSSSRKLSAVTFDGSEGTYVIGAPEFVLKEPYPKIDEKMSRFAKQGYRVLILARSPGTIKDGKLPGDIKPVAIITIQDHVRADAPATIKWFKENGVDVRVISGDNPVTVSEVARRAGITNAEKYISLEGMSPVEVRAAVNGYTVFGRVTPEQKLIIIKELKNKGRTVAMTGDGVNDILALREADCSIAMAAGSEAARNVSHLVLLDSSFASMPKVVMEGRRVINNVQKSSSLFLFKTIFSMMLALFVIFAGINYIFTPIKLLLLEYFVIGIPSFALALEINNQQIKGKFIFNILKSAFVGALIVVINIIVLYIFKKAGWFGIEQSDFITMAIYLTTGTGIMMLYKLVKPLNVYRGLLLGIMLTLIILSTIYLRDFIGITVLNGVPKILILVIMLQASYLLIGFLNDVLARIKLDLKYVPKETIAE